MTKRYCVVTIDTEPDCDTQWRRSNPLSFRSITHGIPDLLEPIFKAHHVKPVYFVSSEVLDDKTSVQVLKTLLDAGRCEIGTHLHPEYIPPERTHENPAGTMAGAFASRDITDEIEREKIRNLGTRITETFGVRPTCYRAGRFGADSATMKSLAALGYTVDSSVTPGINWEGIGGTDFRGFPTQPYFASLHDMRTKDAHSPILEVPVTIGRKRFPFAPEQWLMYAWLRPTHMTVFEMRRLVQSYLRAHGNSDKVVLVMMFHSMELIPKATPFVRSSIGQRLFLRRLKYIIEYLAQESFSFPTLEEVYENYEALRA